MEWKQECDLLLWQEIVVSEPFKFKSSTRERGKVWEVITDKVEWKRSLSKSPGKQKGSQKQILTAGKKAQEKDDRRGQSKWNIT